jgi:hypothetical protein
MTSARRLAALLVLACVPLEAAEAPQRLSDRLAAGPGGRYAVWVFFKDKGPAAEALAAAPATVSPRALARRALRGRTAAVTVADAPLRPAYVAAVAAASTRLPSSRDG